MDHTPKAHLHRTPISVTMKQQTMKVVAMVQQQRTRGTKGGTGDVVPIHSWCVSLYLLIEV